MDSPKRTKRWLIATAAICLSQPAGAAEAAATPAAAAVPDGAVPAAEAAAVAPMAVPVALAAAGAPAGIHVRVVPRLRLQDAIADALGEEDFARIGVGLNTIKPAALELARNDSFIVVRFFKNRTPVEASDFLVEGIVHTVGDKSFTLAVTENDKLVVFAANGGTGGLDLEAQAGIAISVEIRKKTGKIATFYTLSDPPVVYVARLVERTNGVAQDAVKPNLTLAQFEKLDGSVALVRDRAFALSELTRKTLVVVRGFRGGTPVTNKDAGIDSVVVTTPDHHPTAPWTTTAGGNAAAVVVDPEKDEKVASARHGTEVTVDVRAAADAPGTSFYVNRANRIDAYGVPLTHRVGLWFPLGLVGTDRTKTSDGYVFTAAPVSLAIGSRIWMTKAQYLGISGVFGYAVSNVAKDEAGDTSEFTLKTFAAGFLGDYNGWVNFGLTRVTSFGDAPSPGWMFVIGAGPKVISLGRRL
jgi:hypothetical protein